MLLVVFSLELLARVRKFASWDQTISLARRKIFITSQFKGQWCFIFDALSRGWIANSFSEFTNSLSEEKKLLRSSCNLMIQLKTNFVLFVELFL